MKVQLSLTLILFMSILKISKCITRDLKYLEEKCVLNDFYSKSNIIITFNVTEGNYVDQENKISNFVINVYNRKANKLKQKFETQKTNGKFSFSVKKTGHYKICIIGKNSLIFGEKNNIIFDLNIETSIEVKQRVNETANFKDFDKVNTKMDFVKDKVEQIENMQISSNSIEKSFSESQIKISQRVVGLSIIQIIIILCFGIYHVYSLKQIFQDKISMPF